MLTPGDPAPWFIARTTVNPTYHFDSAAGRYIALSFFGSSADPAARRVLDDVAKHHEAFNVEDLFFFGVTTDPDDERLGRLRQEWPGVVYAWDLDRAASRLYGAAPPQGGGYRPHTVLLDPALRVLPSFRSPDPAEHLPTVLKLAGQLPRVRELESFAPVLVVPWVFEPDFCRTLIALYEGHGGYESGFMREVGGKTVGVADHSFKRRTDYDITDQDIIKAAHERLRRRLVPAISRAFQFEVTRIERHIVACYDAASGGHFRPHRDNTTKGTAHRRFAATINLNAGEYDGGNLRFPEFGLREYRAPTGGAVVFGCSLLHEATPVTAGKRYAFLPFLYDEAAAKVRQANLQYLAAPPNPPSPEQPP